MPVYLIFLHPGKIEMHLGIFHNSGREAPADSSPTRIQGGVPVNFKNVCASELILAIGKHVIPTYFVDPKSTLKSEGFTHEQGRN